MPEVDLVICFRAAASRGKALLKRHAQEEAKKAEEQYTRLLQTLTSAGLRAVGRRGEALGHILVFVSCPPSLLQTLVRRERHSDFISGLSIADEVNPLSPADRLRVIHALVASTPADGGLGVSPDSPAWDRVESILPCHDKEFNKQWIHAWTHSGMLSVRQERVREHFGDSIALYFSFLHSYTHGLIFPAVLGLLFFFFGTPYSPTYSILLVLWSIVYVEWWRVSERVLALRTGTRGSFRVERRRAQYQEGLPWWKRELRMLMGFPVILLFGAVLVSILTGIFVFEAFLTQLYTGPGHKYISFSPTILFVALVPQLLAVYQAIARRITSWENHAHQSSHAASLTIKTFTLSALVAYLGLALSAFVYVPFGEGIMQTVQVWLFNRHSSSAAATNSTLNATAEELVNATAPALPSSLWNVDTSVAGQKLNAARLRDQMFAYTVTNQVVNTFVEIGLPFVLRKVGAFRAKLFKKPAKINKINGNKNDTSNSSANGASSTAVSSTPSTLKKRVVFEDEQERGGLTERAFLEEVRKEVALPVYEEFEDYSEMVTQFGYVVLWSTIWPLAPVMALINNFFELRSDAFKLTVHVRRPLPVRTDTIGPWLDALGFLTWLGALTNSALVYLFCPRNTCSSDGLATQQSPIDRVHKHILSMSSKEAGAGTPDASAAARDLLLKALLIALLASHGYIAVRAAVRHVVEKVLWSERAEVQQREEGAIKARGVYLAGLQESGENSKGVPTELNGSDGEVDAFWEHDDGVQEIQRLTKEA
ncbi:calcium-activated chloride channel-domain-containing protein [Mycena amicta]|nr:calcium-activated chloride channel-domain-containing protein [Mycena amicta]